MPEDTQLHGARQPSHVFEIGSREGTPLLWTPTSPNLSERLLLHEAGLMRAPEQHLAIPLEPAKRYGFGGMSFINPTNKMILIKGDFMTTIGYELFKILWETIPIDLKREKVAELADYLFDNGLRLQGEFDGVYRDMPIGQRFSLAQTR